MPRINTHLHLALKLSQRIRIDNLDSFFLGNAYPDCWHISMEQSLCNHYKSDPTGLCNLESFKREHGNNDFDLGYFFHLWIDNRILEVNTGNISKQDCMICDMEIIAPLIQRLKMGEFEGEELLAMQNISLMEAAPIPTLAVSDEKKVQYQNLLEMMADEFAKVLK